MTGKTLGKYRIVDTLGRGGMGTVYRAVDETLEREVAVKVLNPGLSDPAVMKRFQSEAMTLARLNHPDIATIHEIYQSEGDMLMVMELVRGETLDELLQRSGVLPPERAAYLVAQVLGALDHAHRAGVIHRDLKPANVMVTEYGGIKVMDFGIAHVAGSEHVTAAGFMLGTPAYMAPERVLGQPVDARSDLYSAGVLFYRLITGALPFKAESPTGIVQQVLHEEPTPAREYRPELPGWCQAILDRALAKSPDERFQNAEVFRATLVAAISSVGSEETGLFLAPDPSIAALGGGADDRTLLVPNDALAAAVAPASGVAPAVADSADATAPLPDAVPPRATPNVAAPSPGVVLEKKQFAIAGGLVGLLFVAVVVLAFLVIRRPTVVHVPVPLETPPAETVAAATPAGTPAAGNDLSASATAASPAPGAPTGDATPAASASASAPVVVDEPPIRPVTAGAPPNPGGGTGGRRGAAPAPALRTVPAAPPFTFDGKVVVADGDKRRERDASVRLADGTLTVAEKSERPLFVVPLNTVTELTYSNSRQPLWNSPNGPAEAMRVESGAFGFMKGGRNWFGVRTADSFLVLRVDDAQVAPVTSALQERTGLTLQRLVEPKD